MALNPSYGAEFWDNRYATSDFVFGTEPNDFLRSVADRIPAGPVLCLAEGEGRNAVFLATRGHAVTATDLSATGLAKARALAAQRGVALATEVADLAGYAIATNAWSGIVAIFVMEAYTPAQLAFGTGGPKDPALTPTLAQLSAELPGLEFEIGRECERDVHEGGGHTGRSAVVQILARRPV